MANASYIQDSFAGGEKSQLAQGRIGDKEYRTWMNVCVNGHPTEAGGWIRRSGTMYGGHTRKGVPGRVYRFDFAAATPYTMEFTDGFIRFREGTRLASTNDSQTITAISSATPAVVATLNPHGWSTGNTVILYNLRDGVPVLQNRQFTITIIDSTHMALADALTGIPINGAALGAPFGVGTISRVQEVASPYFSGLWKTVRSVQAETTAVLLHGSTSSQIITAAPPPVGSNDAVFSIATLNFIDGPYLDPPTNGVQAVPSGTSGNIIISLAFPAWSATQAYQVGSFVNSASVNYISIINNNVGNTPVSSPTAWSPTSAGAAINNGKGFLGTDIGRMIRLLSEPAIWLAASTYTAGTLVSYNPTGAPGASTYWTSLISSNTGNIPGNNTTSWQLTPSNAAIWSWGKITGFSNQIASGSPIGNLTQDGGIAAAFNGLISQPTSSSAVLTAQYNNLGNFDNTQQFLTIDGFVGKNFSSSPQIISSATIYPPSDTQTMTASSITGSGYPTSKNITAQNFVANLRASATVPSSPSAGTLLGTTGNIAGPDVNIGNGQGVGMNPPGSIVLGSNDQSTMWNYVWVEFVMSATFGPQNADGETFSAGPILTLTAATAQVQFFSYSGTGTGNAVNVEILGPPLLYTNPCITWRLGAYSGTTGWPTVGTYHQGRIWLAGAIDNRFDGSVSNGLTGTTLNMAPTASDGTVGAANGVTGVVNSDSANPIFWMVPDLQGIIMGTQAGEWLLTSPSPGAISATNIDAVRVTKIGSAFVEPRRSDHTIVFVQRYTKKVMEYFTDVYSGKFAAPNLAKDTMHITKPTVAELAYTNATTPIIWGRNNDGSWWGATYKRDTLATSTGPTINGWHRHTLGSGRSVQSIAAGPSVGGNLDALTMVTLDSSGIYHVEVMTDAVEEGDTLLQATYLDDAVNPTSTNQVVATPAMPFGGLTLNGLWHLNGKTVTAWLGGLDCGDYTVTNGSITVPYGDGISAGTAQGLFAAGYAAMLSLSQMLVGFSFTSQGQIVRPATPAESGARNGPAVGKVRRNHKVAAQLEGTGTQVSFGYGFADAQRNQAKFRQLNDVALLQNQQFTGVYKDTLTDPYSFDGMICWQVKRPYPLNIANIGGFIETSDE